MIDAFLQAILLARDEHFFEGDANAAEGNSSSPTYPLWLRSAGNRPQSACSRV
jgi:hypothetical protein